MIHQDAADEKAGKHEKEVDTGPRQSGHAADQTGRINAQGVARPVMIDHHENRDSAQSVQRRGSLTNALHPCMLTPPKHRYSFKLVISEPPIVGFLRLCPHAEGLNFPNEFTIGFGASRD